MHKCNPNSTSLNDANGCKQKSSPFRSKIERKKEFILWGTFMRNEVLRKNFPSPNSFKLQKTNSHGSLYQVRYPSVSGTGAG